MSLVLYRECAGQMLSRNDRKGRSPRIPDTTTCRKPLEREDRVGIRNRQDLAGAVSKPAVARPAVAGGAVAVAAGAVLDELMGAVIALPQVGAEGGGPACANVAECLELLSREHVAPAISDNDSATARKRMP